MAWHWENTYGCRLPAVCSGESHCRAEQVGEVSYSTSTFHMFEKLYLVVITWLWCHVLWLYLPGCTDLVIVYSKGQQGTRQRDEIRNFVTQGRSAPTPDREKQKLNSCLYLYLLGCYINWFTACLCLVLYPHLTVCLCGFTYMYLPSSSTHLYNGGYLYTQDILTQHTFSYLHTQ